MPENNLMSRVSYDDVVDVKQQSLYARLKRLFATDVIVRNVGGKKLKIKDSDEIQYATDRNSLRDRFNRVRSTAYNAYTRDFALSYQAARLDLFRDYDCVGPDTIIPLPDGTTPTIAELTEKYKDKPQERFFVFSYDHKTDSIKLGKAYHPRKKKGTRYGYKVTFDNGQYVIGSIKHPFLMRDGTYKRILELEVGDSVMPFYQKNKINNEYHQVVYNFSYGWSVFNEETLFRPILLDEAEKINFNEKEYDKVTGYSPQLNHKIVSIECIGPIEVYDVTVEKYHNFATDSVFASNTMDLDPVLSAALDIYSEEATAENEVGEILTIDSKNNNIKDILHNLFYDILNIEFNLYSWVRNTVKYGDFYLKLNISPEYGVYLVEPLSAYNVERIENSDPLNKNYVKFQVRPVDTSQAEVLESFQVAHFRLLTDSNFAPYGRSMIEPARRVWKQLCIHENSEIWTSDGYKQIKNITAGNVVYSYNFDKCCIEPTKVVECINTGNKDTYEIKTKHRVLHATLDHQLLVKDKNGNYVYKQINELVIDKNNGDLLVLPTVESESDSYTVKMDSKLYYVKLNAIGKEYVKLHVPKIGIIQKIKSLNQNHPYKQIHAFLMGDKSIPYDVFQSIKIAFNISEDMYFLHIKNSKYPSFVNKDLSFTLDQDFIRFFGFMLGDGWTSEKGIGFALGIYGDINQIYTSTIKKYCDSYYISRPKNNDTHPGSFVVFCKELKYIMECTGYKTGFRNKDIPAWVYNLSKRSKKEFIRGLFDADGSWKWGVIGLSNEKMITQLKHLCQQSGIMCNEVKCYKPEETIDENGVHRFPTYKLYINFNYEYDLEFERVLSVSLYEKNSNVYDLQVESENHNFITNGVVIHNCLLEDALLIHRIMRAPERRIFKIDIGNIPPNEVDNFMEKTISKLKKVPYIDERTGDYNLRFNLQNMTDDYFFAVRGSDSGTSIDTLPGMEFTGIDDLEYIKTKMMAALKIPKAFLNFDEGIGRANLSQEDVRFSKTIGRIQKMIIAELEKIAQVHLYAQGYRDASIVDFKLGLTNPSTIFEKEKMEIWASKLENAKSMWEMSDGSSPFFARKYVFKKIFKMSDDDIQENEQQIVDDCKQLWRLKQISEEGNDPAKPFKKINPNAEKEGGGGEGGLGGLGGPGGGPELGGPEGGPEAEGPAKGGPEAGGGGEAKPMKEVVGLYEKLVSSLTPTETKPKVESNLEWSDQQITEKHGEPGPDYVRPSQAGIKKASDYPFGEDPLGDVENNKHSKADRSLPTRFDENSALTYKNIMKSDIENDSSNINPPNRVVKLNKCILEGLDNHLSSSKAPTLKQNVSVEKLDEFLGINNENDEKQLIKEEVDYSVNNDKAPKIVEKSDLLNESGGKSMLDEKNIME